MPSFPIWTMEFGATYPFEDTTPYALGLDDLGRFRGSHGVELKDVAPEKRLAALPSHARTPQAKFPRWKITFIRQNREFYATYRHVLDDWLKTGILEFPSSYQKLEWNCQGETRDIWRFVIQFRASGVRVKRPTTAPSLIAMTDTQVPIIAWERRYLTPRECARLQSMEELAFLPESPVRAFAALGNAVNVELVRMIAWSLLSARRQEAAITSAAG